MAYRLEKRPELRAVIIHGEGDIDSAVVPALQHDLSAAIDAGLIHAILDLREVTYADSSALGLLVWLDREVMPREGRVVLTGANANVSRILELSGLVGVAPSLSAKEDVDEALVSLDVVAPEGDPLWTEEFQMVARTENLASVRERVTSMLGELTFAESALFDIKVALGEALANAVRHGSPEDGQGLITVHIRAYKDQVAIDVVDNGSGFSGEHVCSDDLYASGGRGIMFMRALMDQVEFSCAPTGGTMVTLVKHRSPAPAI